MDTSDYLRAACLLLVIGISANAQSPSFEEPAALSDISEEEVFERFEREMAKHRARAGIESTDGTTVTILITDDDLPSGTGKVKASDTSRIRRLDEEDGPALRKVNVYVESSKPLVLAVDPKRQDPTVELNAYGTGVATVKGQPDTWKNTGFSISEVTVSPERKAAHSEDESDSSDSSESADAFAPISDSTFGIPATRERVIGGGAVLKPQVLDLDLDIEVRAPGIQFISEKE